MGWRLRSRCGDVNPFHRFQGFIELLGGLLERLGQHMGVVTPNPANGRLRKWRFSVIVQKLEGWFFRGDLIAETGYSLDLCRSPGPGVFQPYPLPRIDPRPRNAQVTINPRRPHRDPCPRNSNGKPNSGSRKVHSEAGKNPDRTSKSDGHGDLRMVSVPG
jgi:hypothetical protein